MTNTQTQTDIELLRVGCDSCGNSRYVVHFLNFITDKDKEEARMLSKTCSPFNFPTHYEYELAVRKARKIGGKRYTAKHYGGGIVFTSNSKEALINSINELMDDNTKEFFMSFNGRQSGAIGKLYPIITKVRAANYEEAINLLYKKYEHISDLNIK